MTAGRSPNDLSIHGAGGCNDPLASPPLDGRAVESPGRERPAAGHPIRELIVRAGGGCWRWIAPLHERIRRLRWAMQLHGRVRRVGRQVYVYGPVWVLGTGDVTLGSRGNIYDHVLFETIGGGRVRIADGFRINRGCVISSHAAVTLGSGCLIGEYTSIRDHNHLFEDCGRPVGVQGYGADPVEIGDDVWLGRGVAVLRGVHIGRGAIIAANSVVTRDVPEFEVWGGAPARFIRRRGEREGR